jgi:DNA repair ATPase RecN
MRRVVFLSLGLLELAVAALLVSLGWQIPGQEDVERSFDRAGRVTERAGTQVGVLNRQVQGLRRMELQELSLRLQQQTRTVSATFKAQHVDFDTILTMRDALGEVAKGLDGLSQTLDPAGVSKLSSGLSEAASFLDEKVIPSAREAADHLDEATAALRADARRLSAVLCEAPTDLKAIREVYKSMARFGDGLDKMNSTLQLRHIETMREGFRGLETSLSTGSEQVERLASYSYPVVAFHGIRPEINQRPFWPEGGEIADGMRKAAAGVGAAAKEVDGIAAGIPEIRASIAESRKMVDRVREALGVALEHQDKLEPLLKEVPGHAARLADELPKLGGDLARTLRETQRLKEVAAALRQAQHGIDGAVARWPELRRTLSRLATGLEATRDQLDQAVRHRSDYEAAVQQTSRLADTFAAMLPLITDQLDGRLDEEERTLSDLGASLGEVGDALPVYSRLTSRLLETGRLLAWLVATIVGLHACYLMLSARMGRRYSF